MKMICALSLVIVCAHVVGCVSTQKPKIPPEFEIVCAKIIQDIDPTIIDIDGPTGKGAGAAGGAVGCGGAAFAQTAPVCVFTGPFLPFCFLMIVMPATTLSAGTCAAIGAVVSEKAEDVDAKHSMLADAVTSLDPNQQLVSLLQQKVLQAVSYELQNANVEPNTSGFGWRIRIAKTTLSTSGFGTSKPFFLRFSADLEILRGNDQEPIFVKSYQSTSVARMTMDEWRVNNDEPVRTTLRYLLVKISSEIFTDLMLAKKEDAGGPISASPEGEKYELCEVFYHNVVGFN